MRVALVSEHASPVAVDLGTADAGGQNVYVDALARHLARLGLMVDVYTRRDDASSPAVIDLTPGVRVHQVDAGPRAPVPKDDLFELMPEFATRLADAWRWRRPDVVHAHFWMSGWASDVARARRPAPLVQTFHALGVVKRRHQGADDHSPPARLGVEQRLLRAADAVVATCRDELDELLALGGRRDRITVVPCGVDERFRPGTSRGRDDGGGGGGGGKVRVTSLGRMVPRKGVADVIAAFARVPANVELVIAGGPPADELHTDAEICRLQTLAADLGVANRCRFVGRLDRDQTADLLRNSDIIACTPWYEPFGIVPIEAMSSGVPVIGTAVGGLRDTIDHGITGLLVEPQRPELIAMALNELASDPARRRRMGQAGVARVERLYRWPHIARSIAELYARVAARTRVTERAAL